ncbi:hypothetical protein ScPMuIL_008477 [Solemya velum]
MNEGKPECGEMRNNSNVTPASANDVQLPTEVQTNANIPVDQPQTETSSENTTVATNPVPTSPMTSDRPQRERRAHVKFSDYVMGSCSLHFLISMAGRCNYHQSRHFFNELI